MTTIHSLPIEILYKILAHSYPYKTCDLYNFYQLRSVCRLWKNIIDEKWLYSLINKMGNYQILFTEDNTIHDITTIQSRIHDMTQFKTIEKNYDSRLLEIFGEDSINKITKIPVIYGLKQEILDYPEMLPINYNNLYDSLTTRSESICRGITDRNIHFMSFRIYNSIENTTHIEFLFHDKKKPYFDHIRNQFINAYPQWNFSSNNRNEIHYLGDTGLRIKKEICLDNGHSSYIFGKELDAVNIDYITRLIRKDLCGLIIPQTILTRKTTPPTEIRLYVETNEFFNRIDEETPLTAPLVYLN